MVASLPGPSSSFHNKLKNIPGRRSKASNNKFKWILLLLPLFLLSCPAFLLLAKTRISRTGLHVGNEASLLIKVDDGTLGTEKIPISDREVEQESQSLGEGGKRKSSGIIERPVLLVIGGTDGSVRRYEYKYK